MRTSWKIGLVCAVTLFPIVTGVSCKNNTALKSEAHPGAERSRFYLLFIDLTLSLNDSQTTSVRRSLNILFAAMPPRSRVIVFPLGASVEHSGPLLEASLPDELTTLDKIRLTNERGTIESSLQNAITSLLPSAKASGYLAHTCISDALRQASQTVRQARTNEDVEIVLVSDMLEDCGESILGGALSLEKDDATAELKRVRAKPKSEMLLDLRHARVTAILPSSGVSKLKIKQPSVDQIRQFWRAVLDHCNDDPEFYNLDTSLPDDLGHLQTPRKS